MGWRWGAGNGFVQRLFCLLLFTAACSLFGDPPPPSDSIRSFLKDILEASGKPTPAEVASAMRTAVARHADLYAWYAQGGDLTERFKEEKIPLSVPEGVDLTRLLDQTIKQQIDHFAQGFGPLGVDLLHLPPGQSALSRFAKKPLAEREKILSFSPELPWLKVGKTVRQIVAEQDPGRVPVMENLIGLTASFHQPNVSRERLAATGALIRGYFRQLDAKRRGKILVALLDLPETATPPQQLSAVLQNTGPAFQKLFQLLGRSAESDVLKEASKDLLDNMKGFPEDVARSVLERELGRPVDDVFSEIKWKPISAGTVGQVHWARLRSTGEEVIVKILRPNVLEEFRAEMKLFRAAATDEQTRILIDQLEETIERELDLRIEAKNTDDGLLYLDLKNGIRVSRRVPALPASRNVLVQRFAHGKPLSFEGRDAQTLVTMGQAISNILRTWYKRAIFADGFFHADLHEGNILYETDPDAPPGYQATLIDWGSVGNLTPAQRQAFFQVTLSAYAGSVDLVMEGLNKLAHIPDNRREELRQKVDALIHDPNVSKLNKAKRIIGSSIDVGTVMPVGIPLFIRGRAFLEDQLMKINALLDESDPQRHLTRFAPASIYVGVTRTNVASELWQKLTFRGKGQHTSKIGTLARVAKFSVSHKISRIAINCAHAFGRLFRSPAHASR